MGSCLRLPAGRPLVSGHAAELRNLSAEPTIMAMPEVLQPHYWNRDMVRALPDDGQRYEVVYGELLVTPAPRVWHQTLILRLVEALSGYLRRHPVGLLLASPADISWEPGTLVQPDLFVANLDQARTLDWAAIRTLLLVVEVLSPTTARYDRFTKRRLYQERGIPLYWVVDPNEHVAEIWRPDDDFPRVERHALSWAPTEASEAFTMELAELFRPI